MQGQEISRDSHRLYYNIYIYDYKISIYLLTISVNRLFPHCHLRTHRALCGHPLTSGTAVLPERANNVWNLSEIAAQDRESLSHIVAIGVTSTVAILDHQIWTQDFQKHQNQTSKRSPGATSTAQAIASINWTLVLLVPLVCCMWAGSSLATPHSRTHRGDVLRHLLCLVDASFALFRSANL